ncbi:hypothetical protein CSKR_102129 [Clonorchis sinensis]|uniref:Uncharacterized protein n=1 Tax=Clonorchis sinensis TaxID=79923 RepID=A0A419Q9U2_CLOSI|nr:hypothetical protein CSKR_102129 [Clonorchis sinensis]
MARWLKWLEREFTDRKVRGSNPTSASRLPLSRLGRPGSIPALVLPVAWQLGTERVLQLNVMDGGSGDSCEAIKWHISRTRVLTVTLLLVQSGRAVVPRHVSVGTIFEISQYIFIKETTHKVAENNSTAHDRFRHSWGSSDLFLHYGTPFTRLLKMGMLNPHTRTSEFRTKLNLSLT